MTPGELGTAVIAAIVNEALRQAVALRLLDGDLFDSERTLSLLAQTLDLSAAQLGKLEPVVDGLCRGLNQAVETWVERGFVDVDALREDLAPVFKETKELAEDILESEQLKELDRMVADLEQGGVDFIRTAIAHKLAELLDLSQEQMALAGPVLRKHMVRVDELMTRLVNDPARSRKDFENGYRAIRNETREALKNVLGADQMRALSERLDRLREEMELLHPK